jgi:hypothetical protein
MPSGDFTYSIFHDLIKQVGQSLYSWTKE